MKQQRETNYPRILMNRDRLPIPKKPTRLLHMLNVCANFQRILNFNTFILVNFHVSQAVQLLGFRMLTSAAWFRFSTRHVYFKKK